MLEELRNILIGLKKGENKLLSDWLIAVGVERGGHATVANTARPT